MPAERVSMRKIRDVLRLTHALGMSRRLVGEATGIGKTAVGEYVRRAAVAGLSWPIPDEIDDAELERRLFPPATTASCTARTEPDWSHIHAELKRRGVTLALLWQEYRAEHAQGYAYSWFCERYSDWRKCISPTMRQTHLAGEKLFVDWAGDTMPVFDPTTGEEHRAHIFVAALGASNYTYAEARWTETLPDWIGAHVNALAAIGGVPKAFVPDNLKAGITKPSRYEPGINRTYQDLADHYGCVVLPARVMKPRDKAKVEVAVQIVQRFVLAKLRNRRFFSLAELNAAIRDCVTAINAKVMRRIGKSRNELLETLDRPALNALPTRPTAMRNGSGPASRPIITSRSPDHYYSVPSKLIREIVEARITSATVEIFHKGQRVASHAFSAVRNRHTTITEHMPSAHRRYAEWTPQRMMSEAAKIGPATIALFEAIMKAKPHPEQGFRSCLGIVGLARSYGVRARRGRERGAATTSARPPTARSPRSSSMGSTKPTQPKAPDGPPIRHGNIRGSWLLPLTQRTRRNPAGKCKPKRRHDAHASHRRTPDRARAHRHGQGAGGTTQAARHGRTRLRGAARTDGRPRGDRAREQAAGQPIEVRRACARSAVVEDVDMKAPRGLDKALFAKLAAGDWIARHQNLIIMRSDRHRQKLACLCAWPQGLPRRSLRPLSSRAKAVRCPGTRTRRRPSCPAAQEPGARRTADPRRLGPRHAHARSGSRHP